MSRLFHTEWTHMHTVTLMQVFSLTNCVHENQNRRAPFPADSRHYRKRVLVEYREQIKISVCGKCKVLRKSLLFYEEFNFNIAIFALFSFIYTVVIICFDNRKT